MQSPNVCHNLIQLLIIKRDYGNYCVANFSSTHILRQRTCRAKVYCSTIGKIDLTNPIQN